MIATETLRAAMHGISQEKGEFTLFGLFMRPDAPGTWDLVVSAAWLEEGKLAGLSDFMEILSRYLTEDELKQLSRVVTVKEGDPALDAVLRAVSVEDGDVRVQHSNFFGLEIEDALILRAKRVA